MIYLLKFFQAYVLAGRYIANDPKTPIWNTGDKYDEASKELYRVNTTKKILTLKIYLMKNSRI
jgi:hypothetical protein